MWMESGANIWYLAPISILQFFQKQTILWKTSTTKWRRKESNQPRQQQQQQTHPMMTPSMPTIIISSQQFLTPTMAMMPTFPPKNPSPLLLIHPQHPSRHSHPHRPSPPTDATTTNNDSSPSPPAPSPPATAISSRTCVNSSPTPRRRANSTWARITPRGESDGP